MLNKASRRKKLHHDQGWQQSGMYLLRVLTICVVLAGASLAVVSKATGGVVVKTAAGHVQGETEGGVLVFRGIRFAEPPVGKLRFRPPQPPTPWSDVRPALDFAPACPQLVEIDPTENNNSAMAEDCLAVNVWTPHADNKKRPVMVWIHGGAFIDGSARNSWYDGTSLAERGNLVMVSLQYRMGAWGFLELSEISGKEYAESGNLGVLDQIAALQWVRENIAAFGGDPNNITLFGQSAGGHSVGQLMTLPQSKDLFQKAILESGAPATGRDLAFAREVTRAYMKIAGTNNVEELQKLSMVQMRDAQKKLFDSQFEDSAFAPTLDGVVIKEPAMDAIKAGQEANIPLLIGTVLDEVRYWSTIEDLPLETKPEPLLEKQVAAIVGNRAGDVIKAYRNANPDYGDLIIHMATDLVFRLPSIHVAEATSPRQPTYMYLLTYRSTSMFRKYDSAHTMEIPFVFGVTNDLDVITFIGRDSHREALEKQVQQAWINFARSGDPNHPGLPAWPKYDTKTRATMELGINSQVVNDPQSEQRRAWEGTTPTPEQISAIVSESGAQ
jgi:para-nitrobenzyl esterase